ncbi:MAG: serine/threonine-protein phosphatase [Eubacterium sp.]|nr:serine/threonine-protein phosphatase [Eubacterium sp.]
MITFAQLSEVGEREVNEDSVGFVQLGPDIALMILADGLGGHGRGEDASALITQQSQEIFRWHYRDPDCLARCFEVSQKALIQKQINEGARRDLKSTLVLLRFYQGQIQWGHVGDSRLYYFKDGYLMDQTKDHSVPQMLVVSGEITPEEIRHHPDRNRLIRVMGIDWDSPKYQLSPYMNAERNQAFLLCSDGFWENIEEAQMEACLRKSSTVHEWLGRMERIVLKNGRGTNMDNYSAVGAFVL